MNTFKSIVAKLLRNIADKIEADITGISGTEAFETASMLTHHVLSKKASCRYLGLSEKEFDELIRNKEIPAGRRRTWFKEDVWWKDELDACMNLKK